MATDRSAEDAWADRLGHLLWEVSTRATLLGEAALARHGLTFAAIGLLDVVADHPGITAAEIARRSPKTPQAVSQVANRMEKLGYVERKLATGRGVGLHITPEGEQVRTLGNRVEREFDDELRALLGDERYEQLRRLLREANPIMIRATRDA
jgi:DNA-binding MarR family transcriptional regulator